MRVSTARWFRLAELDDPNAVACTTHGAFAGHVPLLRGLRRATGEHLWDARPTAELNAALTERYGIPIETGGKQAGLAAVARALNRGDLPLAQIATLHLRMPNPPDMAKSISSLKAISELVAQLAESGLLKVMWNPEKHPRTGEAPNPGWFAPAGDDASTDAAATNSGGDVDRSLSLILAAGFMMLWSMHGWPC